MRVHSRREEGRGSRKGGSKVMNTMTMGDTTARSCVAHLILGSSCY